MGTVLVTGGTGFIGPVLVRQLVSRGDRVRCLVRTHRALPVGVEAVVGDVTQPGSLPSALRDVDVVYHLAGATVVCHPLEYRRANAWGTRNLARACAALPRPPRVVYLSSLAAAGPAVDGRPREEADPPAPVSHYGKSKLAGEAALRAVADRVPTTVVRGVSVFGPGDPNTLRLFRAAKLGLNGVPGTGDLGTAWIYVDDMARALLAAEERGARLTSDPAAGVYYAALAEQPTMAEVGSLAGRAVGRADVRTVGTPRWFCTAWGRVIDVVVALTRQPRLLTSDKMREILAGSWTCSAAKAERELGFRCAVGLADGFERTVAWYRQRRWL